MQGFWYRLRLALFELITRRPFNILIPILVGGLVGPVLDWIGFDPVTAGVLALVIIALLILYLSSAAVRRWSIRRVGAWRNRSAI